MIVLSKKGKAIYWVFTIILFSIVLLFGYLSFWGFSNSNVQFLVVIILCVLILIPIFPEVEIFGVKLKQQLGEIKDEIQELSTTITNSNSSIFNQYIKFYSNSSNNLETTVQDRTNLTGEITDVSDIPINSLITSDDNQVFWYSEDKKRHVFPNNYTFSSWFPFSEIPKVYKINKFLMSLIPLGGNITYKPGVKLLRLYHDPSIYAVSKKRVLRKFLSENTIKEIYGNGWKYDVDMIPDAFFTNYVIGEPIRNSQDYDRNKEIDTYSSVIDLLRD